MARNRPIKPTNAQTPRRSYRRSMWACGFAYAFQFRGRSYSRDRCRGGTRRAAHTARRRPAGNAFQCTSLRCSPLSLSLCLSLCLSLYLSGLARSSTLHAPKWFRIGALMTVSYSLAATRGTSATSSNSLFSARHHVVSSSSHVYHRAFSDIDDLSGSLL